MKSTPKENKNLYITTLNLKYKTSKSPFYTAILALKPPTARVIYILALDQHDQVVGLLTFGEGSYITTISIIKIEL